MLLLIQLFSHILSKRRDQENILTQKILNAYKASDTILDPKSFFIEFYFTLKEKKINDTTSQWYCYEEISQGDMLERVMDLILGGD